MKNLRDLVFLICGICVLCSAALGATVTSKATGLWSAGSTWDSDPAIPVNGDTVIIDTGHEVTFDVDQSGFADGVDLTVTGTFTCSTGAGAYYLMCSADIDGAGTFQAGTSVTALPSTVTFNVDFNAGAFHFNGSGGLTVLLYCTEPTNTYVKLSAQEAAGQTELSVDTDVTGDIWADGDDVCIIDMNVGKDVEITTIDVGGVAAAAITVADVLVAQKESGAYIVLLNRNIKVSNVPASSNYLYYQLDSTSYIRCENDCMTDGTVSYLCDGTEFAGIDWESTNNVTNYHVQSDNCIFSGIICGSNSNSASYGIIQSEGVTFSGMILGMYNALLSCHNPVVSGEIRGCYAGVYSCTSASLTSASILDNNYRSIDNSVTGFYYGTISNSNRGVQFDKASIYSCTFDGNIADLYYCISGRSYNTLFESAAEFGGYNDVTRGKTDYFESFDHDQVTNAFKAWCRGGIVTSQTASPPTGYTIYYQHLVEDDTSTYPVYRQFETTVQPGTAIEVDGYLKNAANGDLTGYEPALQIIDKFADPLVDSTQSPLDEDEIPEPDSGTEAGWQAVDVIWANSGDSPRTVIVRMIAWHDGGGDDVVIDEAWSIATYKDQINTLYDDWANDGRLDLILDTAAAGGGGATAEEVRIEMDDNSTQLAAIVTFVTEIIERLKRIWAYP